jgi:two-component system nitrate/nitrite response regulator NarL
MPAPRPSSPNGPIRVISADAQPMFRDALARAIRQDRKLDLVAEAENAEELASAIWRLAPDVAVVEAEMLELPVKWETGSTRLLLLATEVLPVEAYDAIAQGAAGYLSKDVESPAIRRAIAAVARGETVLDRSAQTGIAKEIRLRTRDDRPELSSREQEILVLIADGQTAPQIARRLHLSTATVATSPSTRCSSVRRARASGTSSALAARGNPRPPATSWSPTTRPTPAASAATPLRSRRSTSWPPRSRRHAPARGPRSSPAPSSRGGCCSDPVPGGTSACLRSPIATRCAGARPSMRLALGASETTCDRASPEVLQQLSGVHVQSAREPYDHPQARLALAAFEARDLGRGDAGPVADLALTPSQRLAARLDRGPEASERLGFVEPLGTWLSLARHGAESFPA